MSIDVNIHFFKLVRYKYDCDSPYGSLGILAVVFSRSLSLSLALSRSLSFLQLVVRRNTPGAEVIDRCKVREDVPKRFSAEAHRAAVLNPRAFV